MGNLEHLSQGQLKERRQHLRNQRRWGVVRGLWQFLLVSSAAVGMGWVMSRPGWVVRDTQSIQVEGTVFLSPDAVRSHLPIDYPTALFNIPIDDLEAHLKALDPIADAAIRRQLFPPRITVNVQEYHPVAILVGHSYDEKDTRLYKEPQDTHAFQKEGILPIELGATGFLDENGTWLPLGSYQDLEEGLGNLPTLRVLGMKRDYRKEWSTMYQQILQSPVEVLEIDWRQLDNLILKTELGITHHGPYDAETFPDHLKTIDEMRGVERQIEQLDQVEYFDLRSLDSPLIQYYPN